MNLCRFHWRVMLIGVVAFLSACGGGDYEEEEHSKSIGLPMCQERPEVCK